MFSTKLYRLNSYNIEVKFFWILAIILSYNEYLATLSHFLFFFCQSALKIKIQTYSLNISKCLHSFCVNTI